MQEHHPATARLGLDFAGCRIAVTSRDHASLAWLREFLTPQFKVVDLADADHEIHPQINPAEHAELLRRMAVRHCTRIETFSFDGYLSLLPAWMESDRRCLYDNAYGLFYTVDSAVRRVRIVAAVNQPRYRKALMRVCRELASIAQHRAGNLLIHAAAFAAGNTAVLLCGPKYSGKTTLLIHALRCGARFISNDRVFVDGDATVRGMPTIVSLRRGTLELHAELHRKLLASGYRSYYTLAESVGGTAMSEVAREGASLSGRQLCHLMNATMIGAAPLTTIVFPRICTDLHGLQFRPLAADDAYPRLLSSLLTASDAPRLPEAFVPGNATRLLDTRRQEHSCRELVARVTCYECLLGREAYSRTIPWQQPLAA